VKNGEKWKKIFLADEIFVPVTPPMADEIDPINHIWA
jgi:hypothetical protein